MSNTLSIDDFFRQLEAKEKDLDISSELVIEIEDSDFADAGIPEFVKPEPAPESKTVPYTHNFAEGYGNDRAVAVLKEEVAELQTKIAAMETERARLNETNRRRHSEFENFKNRTERERSETFRNQLSNLALQMLPVVDNLNRALDSTEAVSDGKSRDFQQFFEGIILVSQQLNEILAEMGVQPIPALGKPFDPHLHEAVATEAAAELPVNTVTAELLRGYQIGDKVIRPTMVKVSTGSEK